eukprot:SAG11_NODE_1064_length_5994_cov_4.748601_6_plen_92_part_00
MCWTYLYGRFSIISVRGAIRKVTKYAIISGTRTNFRAKPAARSPMAAIPMQHVWIVHVTGREPSIKILYFHFGLKHEGHFQSNGRLKKSLH